MIMKRSVLLLLVVCGPAYGQGYLADIEHSATSVLLPCIALRALDDTPAGGTLETGITASTAGLEIRVKADNSSSWTAYTQATTTINNKSGSVGSWETPDASDAHIKECETSGGTYQIDLPDSTWSVASAKYVQILIRDVSSPTFADTLVTVNLNAVAATDLVDLVWDEPCSGHTTSDTPGDNNCDGADSIATAVTGVSNAIADLTDGTTPVHTLGITVQTGAAQSGTLSSFVDTGLTEADVGYWSQGAAVLFTSGSISGQVRCVTNFVPGTDTISFWPATTQAVSTNSYVLIAAPTCRNFP